MSSLNHLLHQLAGQWGVLTRYTDARGRRRHASTETLLAVLRALGPDLQALDDVPAALQQHREELLQQLVEPVIVAWEGELPGVPIKVGPEQAGERAEFDLELEDGDHHRWACPVGQFEPRAASTEAGERPMNELTCEPPEFGRLPLGYHRLTVRVGRRHGEALVIAAPTRVYAPPDEQRTWGAFVPLYALQSETGWGGGNLGDLEQLWKWISELGGNLVATLPLMAAFLDEPCEPSPYMPVTRLFWNEFYVEPRQAPEFDRCRAAQDLVNSDAFQRTAAELRAAPFVQYREQARLQRQVLEPMAECFFESDGSRRERLEEFRQERPDLDAYARFRAACQRQRGDWLAWPEAMHNRELTPNDYDERDVRYHQYVQLLAHEQVRKLTEDARRTGPGLYLDLPLGVHRGGYDTWHERDAFAMTASGGAPPDLFFTKGQDWGLPPLHPQRLRLQHHRYFISLIRHQLQYAGMLRLDHVMGLHRLYWVPFGMPARQGAYVRYPAEELYAILSLESHRSCSIIVGENLGTVPGYVNQSLRRHGVGLMWVLPFETPLQDEPPLRAPLAGSIASLNTHDMPPFAAFWQAQELDDLFDLGLLDQAECDALREDRAVMRTRVIEYLHRLGFLTSVSPDLAEIVDALHAFLADSRARVGLVNLEDLWLETRPQNMPGTTSERPNWQRKTRYSLEQILGSAELRERLVHLADLRRGRKVSQ